MASFGDIATMPIVMIQEVAYLAQVHAAPERSAEVAELHYVRDDMPGITRKKRGKSFVYFDPKGRKITDKKQVERLNKLAIPPAYRDVWICPDPAGHLQATGRAENGKKQYIYHPRWREIRDITKYGQIVGFAERLPDIRTRVEADLRLKGLPRRKVLAAVVRLLERTLIRIGNEKYARANDSYGLTTITKDHVDIHGNRVRFEFKGKGGKEWTLDIQDARIARIVKKCESLPGYELFQYIDLDGHWQDVDSRHVNEYLKEITGEDITAKFFRTWAGTVAAFRLLLACEPPGGCSDTKIRHIIADTVKQVAGELGNTPAVCRKSYIHPEILSAYQDGRLHDCSIDPERCPEGLHPEEAATLTLLKARLAERMDQA